MMIIIIINQIRKHRSYEKFQSILSSSIFFHIITIDFVFVLFKFQIGLNCLKSIIDKFSKRIIIISEKTIYTVMNWVEILLH